MATIAPRTLLALFDAIHDVNRHAVLSGIVGDARHVAEGNSYHLSYEDCREHPGYSTSYPADRERIGKPVRASAIDISFSPGPHETAVDKMMEHTARLMHAAKVKDPRVRAVAEIAGTVNGRDVTAFDLIEHDHTFGWDNSHLSHIHLSIKRGAVIHMRPVLAIAELFAA